MQKTRSSDPVPGNSYKFAGPFSLFRRRLIGHIREQYGIIRTAADWTVLVYFIIPGLLLGGKLYYGLWHDALPAWSAGLPFMLISALLAVLMQGGIVLFTLEGDLLFLHRRQGWLSLVMRGGLIYSLTVSFAKLLLGYVLVLPFMVRAYGASPASAAAFLLLTLACGACVKILKRTGLIRYKGWRRGLWQTLAITVPCGLYVRLSALLLDWPLGLLLLGIVYAAGAAALTVWLLRQPGVLSEQVREDFRQRMKIAGLLLMQVIDKPKPTRHKSRLFRKSQQVVRSTLPHNRLADAGIKALLRNSRHLKLYAQFTGVSLVAILISPLILKLIMYVVLTLMMTHWLFSYWSSFAGDDFIRPLPFTKDQKADAGMKALSLLILPYTALCAVPVCLAAAGWWGLLLFIPAGLGLGYLAVAIFGAFRLER